MLALVAQASSTSNSEREKEETREGMRRDSSWSGGSLRTLSPNVLVCAALGRAAFHRQGD